MSGLTEQQVIERLKDYKRIEARIQVLSSYSVGMGITISRLNDDDQLQELHRRLRGLPSYMYLNKREQELETIANAYLKRHPAGIAAQKRSIPRSGADEEDEKMLRELRQKIQKVITARGWEWPDDVFDEVLDRLSELQDLQVELTQIDNALSALESYKPDYTRLLRLHYIEGKTAEEIAESMSISRRTFFNRKQDALNEFIKLH